MARAARQTKGHDFDIEQAELEAFVSAFSNATAYPIPNEDVVNGIYALEAIYTSVKFVAIDRAC